MKRIRLVLLIFCLFNCSEKRIKHKFPYDLQLFRYEENGDTSKLSDFVRDLKYIQLETGREFLIDYIRKIEILDESIIILDARNNIYVFNKDGHFINRISREGHGPGELFNVFDFCIIPESKQIGILNKMNKIDFFTTSGSYVKTIKLEHFATNIVCLDSNGFALYIPKIFTNDTIATCIFIVDEEGNTISSINYTKVYPEERKSPYLDLSNCFYTENGKIIYSEGVCCEYIYEIDNDGKKKEIIFYNLKDKLLPYHLKANPEQYRKMKSHYIEPFRFLLTDKFFFFSFEYKGCINNAVYNLEDGNLSFKECKNSISNDIDGIFNDIWPINITKNNELVFAFYPKDFVSEEKIDNQIFKMVKQKPKLDDNPIVLIGEII